MLLNHFIMTHKKNYNESIPWRIDKRMNKQTNAPSNIGICIHIYGSISSSPLLMSHLFRRAFCVTTSMICLHSVKKNVFEEAVYILHNISSWGENCHFNLCRFSAEKRAKNMNLYEKEIWLWMRMLQSNACLKRHFHKLTK